MIPMRNRSFDLFELLGGECENPLIAFANFEAPLLQANITALYRTAGAAWVPSGGRRFQLYEAEFGQAGTPSTNDVQVQWDLSRFGVTNAMTGSTVASNALDSADLTPSVTLFMNNQTAEPTYTTVGAGLNLKYWGINQRGSYRWRALDDGDNIIVPAATTNGVGLRTQSTSTLTNLSAVGNISFVER
jgi:hypothetical protein